MKIKIKQTWKNMEFLFRKHVKWKKKELNTDTDIIALQNWIDTMYCHRKFRPLSKPRLCYNTILLKGASDGETKTKNLHSGVGIRLGSLGVYSFRVGIPTITTARFNCWMGRHSLLKGVIVKSTNVTYPHFFYRVVCR